MATILLSLVSLVVAVVSLSVTFFDRRVKLLVRYREGKWVKVDEGKMYGVIELYNRSSRPNAISSYKYKAKNTTGEWIKLESERYEFHNRQDTPHVHNRTPLVIAPYSGVEARIACFGDWQPFPRDLNIELTIVNIFENSYSVSIPAENLYSSTHL